MIRSRMAWAVATKPVAIGRGARILVAQQRKHGEDGILEFDEPILVLRAGQRWNGLWAFETRFCHGLCYLVLAFSSHPSRGLPPPWIPTLLQDICGLHIWQVASRHPGTSHFSRGIHWIS